MLINAGLSLFVYNGDAVALSAVSWSNNIQGLYRITPTRTGWASYRPGQPFNAFSAVEKDVFYLISALQPFTLPDAQTISCATAGSAVIPDGLSMFIYAGPDLDLGAVSWDIKGLYQVLDNRWISFRPGQAFNAFSTLTEGFYFISVNTPFTLEGVQVVGCAETYGSENIDGSKYVRYTNLKGEISDTDTVKDAPNMILFKQLYDAFTNHNHDTRYYQKFESYTRAEVDLFLQGVDEVIEHASLGAFPATGLASKLYIAADTNTGYRWNGSGYTPVSSPGVDLSPYLKIADAEATFLKKTDAANTYQPKGDYIKSIALQGFTYFPDGTGKITLFYTYDLLNALRTVIPGYNATVAQSLRHAANGPIQWGEETIVPPVYTGNSYVKAGYVNSNYVK